MLYVISFATASEGKERGMDGMMSDGEFWAYKIIQLEDSLAAVGVQQAEGKYNLTPKAARARRKMLRTLGYVRAVPTGPLWRRHKAFENLLLHVAIQLRLDAEMADVIGELDECWRRISPTPVPENPEDEEDEDDEDEDDEDDSSDENDDDEEEEEEKGEKGAAQKKKGAKGEIEEKVKAEDQVNTSADEPESMAVFVDILISLLAKPSGQLRQVVGLVFRGFTSMLTPAALRLLVDTVSSRRDDSLLDPDIEPGKKPRYRRSDADEEDDDDDEEEELLDDEQMMQMDAKLSEIFKLMKTQKSSDKGNTIWPSFL